MADRFTAAKASDIKHNAPEGDADDGIEVRMCLGVLFSKGCGEKDCGIAKFLKIVKNITKNHN